MVSFYENVDIILDIIEEAKNRNYPTQVLKYDLNKFLKQLYKESEETHDEELKWERDDAYDEGQEDGYSDGYSSGIEDGKDEAYALLVEKLADKIINLKQWLLDENPTKKDIQLKMTELLVEMDEKCDAPAYLEAKLEEIDELFNSN